MGRVRLTLYNDKVQDISNLRYIPIANVKIISLGKMTLHESMYLGIGKKCKVFKGSRLIRQGRKEKKNISYLEGHLVREMPDDNKDEDED